jgi:predicted phage replisome organizer
MPEVKWIKITTDMFDDEKIKLIESMPDKDALLIIWIKLITQAGRCNAGGRIFLTEDIPYTEEMLATVFSRPLNTVRLALETFQKMKMIYWDNGVLTLPNFEKHQNIEALELIREHTKQRVQRFRLKQAPVETVTLQKRSVTPTKKEVENNETVTLQDVTVTLPKEARDVKSEAVTLQERSVTPLEERRGEEERELDKSTSPLLSGISILNKVLVEACEQTSGLTSNHHHYNLINTFLNELSEGGKVCKIEWVEEAAKRTRSRNKIGRNGPSYMLSILSDWVGKGDMDIPLKREVSGGDAVKNRCPDRYTSPEEMDEIMKKKFIDRGV